MAISTSVIIYTFLRVEYATGDVDLPSQNHVSPYEWDQRCSRVPTLPSRSDFIVLWLINCAFFSYSERFNSNCASWGGPSWGNTLSFRPYTIFVWISSTPPYKNHTRQSSLSLLSCPFGIHHFKYPEIWPTNLKSRNPSPSFLSPSRSLSYIKVFIAIPSPSRQISRLFFFNITSSFRSSTTAHAASHRTDLFHTQRFLNTRYIYTHNKCTRTQRGWWTFIVNLWREIFHKYLSTTLVERQVWGSPWRRRNFTMTT